MRFIETELDGYVVLYIFPNIYSYLVIHYTHCLFTLISDQVAKWFEINMKYARELCSFLLAYSILNHDIWFLNRKKSKINKQGNQ